MFGVDAKFIYSNIPAFEDKPFFDLIYFSDCEGLIGPAACARLAGDFDAHMRNFSSRGWWYEKAEQWARACRIAAGNRGALRFG